MSRIILNIRVAVSMPKESLPGLDEDWAGPIKKSVQKTYKRLKETLPDIDTVIEKVIKPGLEGTKRMIKQDPARPVHYTRAELEEMARNYLKGMKRGLKPKYFDEAIEFGKKYAAEKLTRDVIPFRGSRKYKVRGLGPFVARLLTGEEFVREMRCPPDKIIVVPTQGVGIDITRAGMRGKFRQAFRSRIAQAGPRIIRKLANQRTRDNESILTCQMINKYKRPDIEPFAPNGKSYLRFVMISAKGGPPGYNQLFLEIQVTCLRAVTHRQAQK